MGPKGQYLAKNANLFPLKNTDQGEAQGQKCQILTPSFIVGAKCQFFVMGQRFCEKGILPAHMGLNFSVGPTPKSFFVCEEQVVFLGPSRILA